MKVAIVTIICKVLHSITIVVLFQTLMSVVSILMAVLTVASTPLGPTYVAVIQDTAWLPTGARVKVLYILSQGFIDYQLLVLGSQTILYVHVRNSREGNQPQGWESLCSPVSPSSK